MALTLTPAMTLHAHPLPDPAPPAEGWVSMRHLQRATALAKAAGIGMDELLERAGVADPQRVDAEQMVPLRAIEAVLGALQRQHGEQLLGLHMASNIQPSTLGAIGHLLQACATFGDLIDVVVRYNGLLSNIGRSSVVHAPGLIELRWECLAGSALFKRHASEYVIGTFVMLTRLLAQGSGTSAPFPTAVHFAHARPQDPERIKEYFAFFGCPVHFGQAHSAITAPSSLLSMRLAFGDAAIKELLERHTGQLLSQRSLQTPSIKDDVRRLLKALILAGEPTKDAVALQMGISPRSLHRRLQEAGTSYRGLLDAERSELACERLASTDAPTTEIARRLGFSSPQAFLRWFRPLLGMTPSQYRQQARLDSSERSGALP